MAPLLKSGRKLFLIRFIECRERFRFALLLSFCKFCFRICVRIGQELLYGTVYIGTEISFAVELETADLFGSFQNLCIFIREIIEIRYAHIVAGDNNRAERAFGCKVFKVAFEVFCGVIEFDELPCSVLLCLIGFCVNDICSCLLYTSRCV